MKTVAERLCKAVAALKLDHGGRAVAVTVSVGTCIWEAQALSDVDSLGQLVQPADAALYEAKRAGRNRACFGPTVSQGVEPVATGPE
jgi:GGDEF domain-containing protein